MSRLEKALQSALSDRSSSNASTNSGPNVRWLARKAFHRVLPDDGAKVGRLRELHDYFATTA